MFIGVVNKTRGAAWLTHNLTINDYEKISRNSGRIKMSKR